MSESRYKAWKEDRLWHRGSRTKKSRTKVCLVCKPMDIASMLPTMRSPLPDKGIYLLKNKRELRLERKAARAIANDDANAITKDPPTMVINDANKQKYRYTHVKKIHYTWKSKHKISKTTGKRVRSRKIKWRMHENEENINFNLSMWKLHKCNGAYALDKTASRSFNRDINAAINIRTLFYCDTYDVPRPANFTETAEHQKERTKKRKEELDEARKRANTNYRRLQCRRRRLRRNVNASDVEEEELIRTTLVDCFNDNYDNNESDVSSSSYDSDQSDNYSDFSDDNN
ncbi:uncharacterized protein LOC129568258 [Sitodiplosis mosellana]|uniref:uncharacterized protein LOC129568258 n=1 Tax=Sitodiplosis mosellana TaxID=263140 RepID=UPI002443DCFA|nr:uncharacterized protein LOC129568258 [Sitodiplosis mosellana]